MMKLNTERKVLREGVPLSKRDSPIVRLFAKWKLEIRGGQQHFPSLRDSCGQADRASCPYPMMLFKGRAVGRFDFGKREENFTPEHMRLHRSPDSGIEESGAAIRATVVPDTVHADIDLPRRRLEQRIHR